MAMSESKRKRTRDTEDKMRRSKDLRRFFRQWPMMLEANWDRETVLYLNEGRMTGIVLRNMAGRSDIVSSRRN